MTGRPVAMLAVLLLWSGTLAAQQPAGFDHAKHAKLFPACTSCHAGAASAGRSVWPDAASCTACHDGTIQKRIAWQVPESLRTNLRFDHVVHIQKAVTRFAAGGKTPPACMDCHSTAGATWMAVQPPVVTRCFACHGLTAAHVAAPDTACATCHLPLALAPRLTRADVAAIDTPPSHRVAAFRTAAGHGAQAKAPGGGVAASCATCHARDFCLACHVDAPEQPTIQALAVDTRSTAIAVRLTAPASHRDADFLERHGGRVRAEQRQCATCHTRESCYACHAGTPRVAAAMFSRSPLRGAGAVIDRRPPESHGARFTAQHAGLASARSATCAGCHVQADCLACHRPTAASAPGYHPAGFLARHPAAAYSRETSCNDCHNNGSFCVTCHASSGLVARGVLGSSGFHDAKRFFILGHGQAARQNLESCVGCHAERDCITCHGSFNGRKFDPHGPGFDAARLRRKNPQMCTACHGTNIPQ
jgi:hypothetical protein